MAFGYSDGDLHMLQWSTGGDRQGFAGIVHHTDAEREEVFKRDFHVGRLDESKSKAGTLIGMKSDWHEEGLEGRASRSTNECHNSGLTSIRPASQLQFFYHRNEYSDQCIANVNSNPSRRWIL